jgi:hypothetical protein
MQTEDKMQTGGELGIFYKFPPSHSHVIVLVYILLNVEASHFHQNGRRRQRCMTRQTAPGSQLQVREPGASSRFDFNLELERLVCK